MTERFEERVPEGTSTVEGRIVMPFYLMLDVSISMTGDLAALQDGLGRMITAIGIEPDLDDSTQVGVLTFSDAAAVVTPLDQVSKLAAPKLGIQGGTNYGAAFRKLAEVIEADRARLKKQGCKIFRPCAFFLSDGEPNDSGWLRTFAATLTYDKESKRGMLAHPIFVPFGFRDAKEADLKRLAYPPGKSKWYHARDTRIEDALAGILDIIKKTVIDSAQSVPAGQPSLLLARATSGSGIASGESEYDENYV